jgi:hypothetical protein
MSDLAGYTHFAHESGQRRCVIRETRRQELQRDGLRELQIVGSINLAHPAAS